MFITLYLLHSFIFFIIVPVTLSSIKIISNGKTNKDTYSGKYNKEFHFISAVLAVFISIYIFENYTAYRAYQ